VRSYIPQLYSVGSRSRFWPYGTPYVRAPIPGTGFQGRRMFYETQPLQLGATPGSAAPLAHGVLLDPRTLFIVGCPGRKPKFERGLSTAIRRARREAKRHRQNCNIMLPGPTRSALVPIVRIGPSGAIVERSGRSLGGLGQDVDPGRVATVIANLIVDPERELSARGDALAQALDRHVATPLVESMGRQAQPYFWKYVFPPLLILYAISSVAAIKAWQAEARLAGRARGS
jgi:hypothetical protein